MPASPTTSPPTAAVALAIAAVACLLSGCGGGSPDDPDAGEPRDAALSDGSLVIDSGADAGPAADAAASDAGSASRCAAGDCDPRALACESGAACVLRDRLPACATMHGMLGEGEACADESACGPGLACFLEPAGGGRCASICCPGADEACGLGRRCSADGVLVSGAVTSWGRCALPRPCDVLAPVCPEREACYLTYPDGAVGEAECRLAGTADVGETCLAPEDCQPGMFCAGIGVSTCVRLCRLDDPLACPEGEGRCIAQAYSPLGSGVCVPPSAL